MSDTARAFVDHLVALAERDRGAIAALRRSLAFNPGAFPAAYPAVERFVGPERHADDPWRLGLYLVAGLYALHPRHEGGVTLASAFGRLAVARDSASIEHRFIALLGAEPRHLATVLRQTVSLLAADGRGLDFVQLLDDAARWLRPFDIEGRDRIRQRWARDFYRSLDRSESAAAKAETAIAD